MNKPGPDDAEISTTAASDARMDDYLRGGDAHFEVDRDTVGAAMRLAPGGLDAARAGARARRAFIGRAVRYLAAEAGMDQFLDLGAGIPISGHNVHQVAQSAVAHSRVVYVDHDPLVLAHAHMFCASTPQGATDYVHADLRDPGTVMGRAARTLDLSEPVVVLLTAVLDRFPGEEPYEIVTNVLDVVPVGSHLVVSHLAGDLGDITDTCEYLNATTSGMVVARTKPEVARFFDVLDMVEPGLVPVQRWRPEPVEAPEMSRGRTGAAVPSSPGPDRPGEPADDVRVLSPYGGVGRKGTAR